MILLISLVIGGTVYSVNAKRIMHNEMPMPFGFGMSVVLSGSMEETLHVNDLVVVQQTRNVEVGDIIVFQSGTDLIIHRVIGISDGEITTQGDANNWPDDPISPNAVKGKMLFSIPMLGLLVRLLQTTIGKILVFILAVFLLLRSHQKERKQDDEQLEQIKAEIRRLQSQQAEADGQDVSEDV